MNISDIYNLPGVFWNARKSMWKMILSCDSFCPFFSKCPKIEEFYFRFLFCFKIDHVHFFSKCPIFLSYKVRSFFEMPDFSYLLYWNSSIFGHFEKMGKSYHMTKSSFTCFFGHFKIPPVFEIYEESHVSYLILKST